jgi:hypothetical protein
MTEQVGEVDIDRNRIGAIRMIMRVGSEKFGDKTWT